jgi:hypothetical protein
MVGMAERNASVVGDVLTVIEGHVEAGAHQHALPLKVRGGEVAHALLSHRRRGKQSLESAQAGTRRRDPLGATSRWRWRPGEPGRKRPPPPPPWARSGARSWREEFAEAGRDLRRSPPREHSRLVKGGGRQVRAAEGKGETGLGFFRINPEFIPSWPLKQKQRALVVHDESF